MRAPHVAISRESTYVPFTFGKRWFEARWGPVVIPAGSTESFSVDYPHVAPSGSTLVRSIFGYTAATALTNDTASDAKVPPPTFVGISWFPVDDPEDGTWSPGSGGEAIYADLVEWQIAPYGDGGSFFWQSPGATVVRESRAQRIAQDRDAVQMIFTATVFGGSDVPVPSLVQELDVTVFMWWRFLIDAH
jgi:hypothetical protein